MNKVKNIISDSLMAIAVLTLIFASCTKSDQNVLPIKKTRDIPLESTCRDTIHVDDHVFAFNYNGRHYISIISEREYLDTVNYYGNPVIWMARKFKIGSDSHNLDYCTGYNLDNPYEDDITFNEFSDSLTTVQTIVTMSTTDRVSDGNGNSYAVVLNRQAWQ